MTQTKRLSLFLSFCLILEQSVFAQTIDLSHYFANPGKAVIQSDKFRPLHLRYLGYDNLSQDFKLLLDKGDTRKEDLENKSYIEENTQTLLKYFFIGLALPNEKFWVNLRPDSPDNILDPDLEKTDIGRIFLEADLQLKKDTSGMTSPQNPEGKAYWDKLYKKAGELFGTENITIPTITRPWIVPNEIIIREAPDNAYIYKATLKVMLEEDYLSSCQSPVSGPGSWFLSSDSYLTADRRPQTGDHINDPRLKELNQYSTQLIKETIIPKLTYAVNTSKRYAPLRQVYYSLILAQWFKQKYGSPGSARASGTRAPVNSYVDQIDSGNLANLTSKEPYDKQSYFQQYQKSFKDGEYNLQEPVYTSMGQNIRRYTSGGVTIGTKVVSSAMSTIPANRSMVPEASSLIRFDTKIAAEQIKAIHLDNNKIISASPIRNSKDKVFNIAGLKDKIFKEAKQFVDAVGIEKGDEVVEVGVVSYSGLLGRAIVEKGANYIGYGLFNGFVKDADGMLEKRNFIYRMLRKYNFISGNDAQVLLGEFSSGAKSRSKYDCADHSQDFVLVLTGALSDPLPESDPKEVMREILRVIKPGGKIFVGSYKRCWDRWEKTDAQKTINDVLSEKKFNRKVRLKLFDNGKEFTYYNSRGILYKVDFLPEDNESDTGSSALETSGKDLLTKKPSSASSAVENKNSIVDSAGVSDTKPGGIAFNALPIQTESVASSALGALSGTRAFRGDLDAEWARIQDVFNSGVWPSIQRLSEYTAAAVGSPLAEDKIDQVRVMLADILRRDEENQDLIPAEESCKQLLRTLESG